MPTIDRKRSRVGRPTAVSLCTGIGGLDLGLHRAGFDIRLQVDIDPSCLESLAVNFPTTRQVKADLAKLSASRILREGNLKPGELSLLAAGFPCQPYSTAGKRAALRDPRGQLFYAVLRILRRIKPRTFLLENVPGILSAARRHRPLNRRGEKHRPLRWDEKPGSALRHMVKKLEGVGYVVKWQLVNAADVGVPQLRRRVLFVGTRQDQPEFRFPRLSHGPNRARAWVTLREAVASLEEEGPAEVYGEAVARVFQRVPAGGCWLDLPKDQARRAMGKAWYATGGKRGFYRRLSFSSPTPTLTSRPAGKATAFCHPRHTRPLAINEYRRIQQFPDDWHQVGPLWRQYTQIGNAVPVGLGKWIGMALARAVVRASPSADPGARASE